MIEAPRWRLNSAHYLNVAQLPDGTKVEWEHKETARETGRTVRKLFQVPMLLDPRDPADFNHPGEIIVAADAGPDGRNDPRDYIFDGRPTPEMEPLNEAAQALTDAARAKWDHPIESLPANGGMTSAEQVFMQNMMDQFSKTIGALPQAGVAVPSAEVLELRERLAKLEALLATQAKAPAPTERRA